MISLAEISKITKLMEKEYFQLQINKSMENGRTMYLFNNIEYKLVIKLSKILNIYIY